MLEEKLNPGSYIRQIRDNFFSLRKELLRKASKKDNLIYQDKPVSSNENPYNIYDSYSKIENSFQNRSIRIIRLLFKIIKILFFTSILIIPISLIFLYFYQFEILLFLIRNNVDTSFISNVIDIMNETIQFIKNIYFNFFNMINSIDFNK